MARMDEAHGWHSFAEPDEETHRIARDVIGAAIEVHRRMGPGHKESVYKEPLCHEFELRGIPFQRDLPVDILYKGKVVGKSILDIVADHRVVIELKAVEQLISVHTAQAISYLKATHLTLALLINFNVPILKEGIRRVVLT